MSLDILELVNEYLELFPEEAVKQSQLLDYVKENKYSDLVDWNNFNGHLVASAFIYAKKEKKFLLIYHKDMKKYVYPGGHIDPTDYSPFEAAAREVSEETGITEFENLNFNENKEVPIDIDTHIMSYNSRLNLPEHYHFDFRYLFVIDKITKVVIDEEETDNYKWVDIDELKQNPKWKIIVSKMEKLI